MTPRRLRSLRLVGMSAAIVVVIALSLGNSGWAQVARAQTVPTLTYTPAPKPSPVPPATSTPGVPPPVATETETPAPPVATQPPSGTATSAATSTVSANLSACGPGPYTRNASGNTLLMALMLGSGSLTLIGSEALTDPSGSQIELARITAVVVPTRQLPIAPAGWRLLTCGLRASAVDSAGRAVIFLTRGLVVCLVPPATGSEQDRLVYFDPRSGINRWVFLSNRQSLGLVCSQRFHLLATFALLSASP